MEKKNKSMVIRFIEEVWNNGNFGNVQEFVSFPYTIYRDPGDPWELKSLDLETFQERVNYSRAIFPDLLFTINELVAEEEKVALSWHFRGTQKGDLPQIPSTGKNVNVSGMTIYYFSKGKITGHWQIVDKFSLIYQLKFE